MRISPPVVMHVGTRHLERGSRSALRGDHVAGALPRALSREGVKTLVPLAARHFFVVGAHGLAVAAGADDCLAVGAQSRSLRTQNVCFCPPTDARRSPLPAHILVPSCP